MTKEIREPVMVDVDRWEDKAVRREQRICFGIMWFATEDEADAAGKAVRRAGITYNGGWFHGMPCGRDRQWDSNGQFAVTY